MVGRVVSVEGRLEVQRGPSAAWTAGGLGGALCEADSVRTGPVSRAAIQLANESVLRLDADTTIRLADVAAEASGRSVLDLVFGALQSFSRKPREIDVNAPHMSLAIRGTEFVVRADGQASVLAVQEGLVLARNAQGELPVPGGGAAVARPGEAPRPYTLIRPEDAAQWALHYPPVLAGGTDDAAPGLADAARLARTGDTAGALAALERVPGAATDAEVQLRRAALFLDVGRVDAAREAIDRALRLDPNAGLAYALRAVIDVAQNRREAALANGRRAVELAPAAAAPRIALSYAPPAATDIVGARDTLQAATAARPDEALAWARLAELQLMLGRRDLARAAAERAAALAPDLARVQTVLGFASLSELRTAAARAAFTRATSLDSADPLPRFGLGLAQIREGELARGRGNLEAAVGLDPGNALLRTYLGRAYFEELRSDIAGQQHAVASDLDPLDPTPHLFEAIRRQTENRPVEALESLERSIALNDNRAVYRGRLLLDSDRAARGASLARIYQDLDFVNTGLREATNSLSLDPTDPNAHRFLADAYGSVRRTEIARVSELLQSQLLQELPSTAVPIALGETNLNIVTQGGPTTPGYGEFTPLFQSNGMDVGVSGVLGSHATKGLEGAATVLHDRFAISASGFGYDTSGWRDNGDIRHKVGNVFAQAALTPDLHAQLEFRARRTNYGDIEQVWDPDDFSERRDRDLDQDSYRAGLRWSPAPGSDLLLSMIYSDTTDQEDLFEEFFFGTVTSAQRIEDQGYQPEAQYIHRGERYSVTAGGAYVHVDRDQRIDNELDGFPLGFAEDEYAITNERGYVYGNLNLPRPVVWTLGLSADDVEQEAIQTRRVNPKLGAQWSVTDDLRLRAAAFQVVKGPLSTNRTLEPTQVAGFNQFFDDDAGTASRRFGLGSDWKITDKLFLGAEATWRYLEVPYFVEGSFEESDTTDWRERTHRLYAYWALADRWALTGELVYDRFRAQNSELTEFTSIPTDVTTYSVPLGLRYFDPRGFFAGVGFTWVKQDLERSRDNQTGFGEGESRFGLVDAQVGYRLPNRFGIVTLQVSNLFDKSFDYQDDSYRESQDSPSVGPYVPERQVLLQVTLRW